MILSLEHQKEVQILKSLYFLELGFVLVTKTAKFLPGMTKMSYLSNIKFRSERTYCAVCYWSTSFKMSVPDAADGNKGVDTRCGSPGINPAFTKGGAYVELLTYRHCD